MIKFPLESFCPEFQSMAQNISSTYDCNTDWIFASMLTIIGFSFEHKYEARLKKDWIERSNLWLILTGNSGTSKSPVLHALTKVISEKNIALGQEYNKRKAIFNDYTNQLKTNKTLKDCKDGSIIKDASIIENFCNETYGSAIVPTKPNNMKCIIEKTTFEKLHYILSDECNNKRQLLYKCDEMIGTIKSFNQYSKGSDYQDFLKLKDYAGTTVERMDESKTFIVPEKNVAVFGGTQFRYMYDIMNDEGKQSGLAFRFLYAIYNETKDENIIRKIRESSKNNRFDDSYSKYNEMINFFMLDYEFEVNRIDLCNQAHRSQRRSHRQARQVVRGHQGDAGPRAELSDDRRYRSEDIQSVWHAARQPPGLVRGPYGSRQHDRPQRLRRRPRQESEADHRLSDDDGAQL